MAQIDLVFSMSLKHNVLVKMVAGYVVASFILMEILWFVWCRPFHDYWKMAPEDCKSIPRHLANKIEGGV
jgi:hypothetical protein